MDPASRMNIDLDGEDSRSSEDSGAAIRPRRNRKEKTPDRQQRAPEGHPHNSDSFVTCSNGDGRDRQHRQEPTRGGSARSLWRKRPPYPCKFRWRGSSTPLR